jgi:hypothetical protein
VKPAGSLKLRRMHNRGIDSSLIVVDLVATFRAGAGTSVRRFATLAGPIPTRVAARLSRFRTNSVSGRRRTSANVAVRRGVSTRLACNAVPQAGRTTTHDDNSAPTLDPPLAAVAAVTPALNRCSDRIAAEATRTLRSNRIVAAAVAPLRDSRSNQHPRLTALNAEETPAAKTGAADVVAVEIATAMTTISHAMIYCDGAAKSKALPQVFHSVPSSRTPDITCSS